MSQGQRRGFVRFLFVKLFTQKTSRGERACLAGELHSRTAEIHDDGQVI